MVRTSKLWVASARLPRPLLIGGVVAIAVVTGLVTWLVTKGDSGSTQPATASQSKTAPIGPIALSADDLRALAGSLGQPVYWAGPEPGRRYELIRTTAGNVFLRYLPSGVKAGDKRLLRTIGTYPYKRGYLATLEVAAKKDAVSKRVAGGWVAVYRRSRPTNIYLARRGYDYQLEVFDSSPAEARQVAYSGKLTKVP